MIFAMSSASPKNFHVPLPPRVYRALKAEADRQKRPATQLAREAIVRSLLEQRRARLDRELRQYVAAAAGSDHDLDEELEAAAAEHLLESVPWK